MGSAVRCACLCRNHPHTYQYAKSYTYYDFKSYADEYPKPHPDRHPESYADEYPKPHPDRHPESYADQYPCVYIYRCAFDSGTRPTAFAGAYGDAHAAPAVA